MTLMTFNTQNSPEIQAVLDVWQPYVDAIDDWRAHVRSVKPKATGCGPVYELDALDRPTESFAIADMTGVDFAQPHKHVNGEVEIYFVLEGIGRVVVGHEVVETMPGDIIVTPSGIAHYAIPDKGQGLVLAVVNTPPFDPENIVDLYASDEAAQFDYDQFKELTK
jgi:mannose-6-phosphate isomerase-like protein (cupin superfamily)